MTLHRGRIARDKQITGVRSLTREDLAKLHAPRQLPVVQRLRDPHHLLARLVASGMRLSEAAARAGYSLNRAMQLMQDPSFQELVQSYRGVVTAEWADTVSGFIELATGNMLKAERQLAERLEAAEEEGETLPVKDLIAISRDGADRLGFGKRSTQINVNFDFAAKLERARARSGRTIEGTVAAAPPTVSTPAQPAAVPSFRRI